RRAASRSACKLAEPARAERGETRVRPETGIASAGAEAGGSVVPPADSNLLGAQAEAIPVSGRPQEEASRAARGPGEGAAEGGRVQRTGMKKRRQRMALNQSTGLQPSVSARDHQTMRARPLTSSMSTNPQTRESEELSRLSPITNS